MMEHIVEFLRSMDEPEMADEVANDPTEFGCACDLSVGYLCGPCLIPDDSGYAVKFEDYCKLETELAALKAENEWRDIETAPKDKTRIICYGKLYHPKGWNGWHPEFDESHPEAYGWDVRMAYFMDGNWQLGHACGFAPTHWMPLPKPPAMAKGEK